MLCLIQTEGQHVRKINTYNGNVRRVLVESIVIVYEARKKK